MPSTSILVDDFEDGVFDTTKWYRSSTTAVREQTGRIEVDATGDIFLADIAQTWNFDTFYLKIGNGDFVFQMEAPAYNNSGAAFRLSGGTLNGNICSAGSSYSGGSSIAYNSTSMAYLRFERVLSVGISLQYSADASTWTELTFLSASSMAVDVGVMRPRVRSSAGTAWVEAANSVTAVPPTTVTLDGAMTATALAVIADAVGPVPVTTVTLTGALQASGLAPVPEMALSVAAPKATAFAWPFTQFGLPAVITLRAEPNPATATGLVLPPTVDLHPPPLTVTIPSMSASALAYASTVFTYLPTTIEATVASGVAEAPTPTVTGISTFAVESMHVATRFPSPARAGEEGYPFAKTSRATTRMLAPTRYGPVGPSIYKAMVERVSPPPIANYHFDGDSGAPVIVGDEDGHSRVFDGIDDYTNIDLPGPVHHTTFVLWWQEEVVDPFYPAAEKVLLGDRGQIWWLMLAGGSLTFASTVSAALNPRYGQRHMVMLTIEDRSDDFPPHGPLVKMFVDGVLTETGQGFPGTTEPNFSQATLAALWSGSPGFNYGPAAFFKGRIDEFAVWMIPPTEAYSIPDGWALELWLQGTGLGGPPTSIEVPSAQASARIPAPTTAIRPVLDSWQLHDDFLGDELNPELWTVGYQGMLQAEGPGGPAPAFPLDEAPFVLDGEMTLRAGTIVSSRDWLSFGEWVARIEMLPIESDSEVIVGIAVFAAYADVDPMYESGAFYKNHYEEQMSWNTYIEPLSGRRYRYRGWGVYSPLFDDAGGYELDVYDPNSDDVAIITSPHPRAAQNIHHADSGDFQPGGGPAGGFVPYWPMEKPYNNPYEARYLRLVIQVSGPEGASVVITGINLTPPTTKIAIPTAQLAGDVETIIDHTYPRPYEGVKGPRSIKAPVVRTTGRFPKPNERASMYVENTMRLDWADFLFPEWAGDARPITAFVPKASAYALLIEPLLFGEPVDVVIEAALAASSGRMLTTTTSGTIKKAFGLSRSETRKMDIKIKHTKIDLWIGMKELVSA